MHGENCQVRIAISKRESEVAQGLAQDFLPLPVQCSNLLETEKERARLEGARSKWLRSGKS